VTGLRDRKKQEVRQRIIAAAGALFAARGLEGTTMDEVAVAAGVSVATVYNYFGSKTTLLVAGVDDDTEDMIRLGQAILDRPGTNPKRAVKRLFSIYFDHLTAWDRELLRQVIASSFRPDATELTAELVQMDARLIEQAGTLLDGFASAGRLAPGVDSEEASLLLFSVLATHLIMFISLEDLTATALKRRVNRQIDLAFNGLAATDQKVS
jgi:AcrR family transcriptional regulator